MLYHKNLSGLFSQFWAQKFKRLFIKQKINELKKVAYHDPVISF